MTEDILSKINVRLLSIELHNFKNVHYGVVELPSCALEQFIEPHADVLGLYGQNGSGKTAIIEALDFLKRLLTGLPLPENANDYISVNERSAGLTFRFYVKDDIRSMIATYVCEITHHAEYGVIISREILRHSVYQDGAWSKTKDLINYLEDTDEPLFTPKYRYDKVLRLAKNSSDEEIKEPEVDLLVAKKLSQKERKSFIFSREASTILFKGLEPELSEMLTWFGLSFFANTGLFIIKNEACVPISLDFAIPFVYKYQEGTCFHSGAMAVSLKEPSVFEENKFKTFRSMIDGINLAIASLVPGLTIEIKEYGPQLTPDGKNGIRFELLSKRNDITIPLRYESEGIKKILSILNLLIAMYNNDSVCLAIDELDSGVFEYLLGEMLAVIEESGRGQLIFTSHNLRPLEMIDKNSIVFTTTNTDNRYLRMSNVKATNNLRDLYLRSINLGGQKEPIYQATKSYEIRQAFRKAGGCN